MATASKKLSGAALSTFNNKHPRGKGGKFAKKGGAAAALNAPSPAMAPTPAAPSPRKASQKLRVASSPSTVAPKAVSSPVSWVPAAPPAPGPARSAMSTRPARLPLPAPSTGSGTIYVARDALYGRHPRANQQAFQLSAYGLLRRTDFDQLDPAERSTVLGDLSHIMATSKSTATVTRATKLFNRFTPPGTPSGHVPAQAVVPPVNAVAGQTRFPDPAGVKGMLKLSRNPGQSGDGWTRLASGGTGPWGKYGAAGLLLRHVDKNGQERFLMVQRGPAISDPGKWQFPGGAIDSKESMAEGATREVVEELGFKESDFKDAGVHGFHEAALPGAGSWKYTSFAATVPRQLKPDLSTHHARQETADAKWMTVDEIRALDTSGKLLKPLQGGAMERNVLSLFPASGLAVSGLRTPQAPPARHKPSTGRDLIPDAAAQHQLLTDVSAVRKNYRGKTADERLAAIGAMQGYDATPTVVSKAEMDRLLATGDYIEAWRGVNGNQYKTAAQIIEEMRSGPAYYGTGVFGNGYYLATQRRVAAGYSDGTKNSLARILIPKAAKTESHSKVLKKAMKAVSSSGGFQYVGRKKMGGGTLHDEGRYAAAQGLDGVEIPTTAQSAGFGSARHVAAPGEPAYNWVNRAVLIIQEAGA